MDLKQAWAPQSWQAQATRPEHQWLVISINNDYSLSFFSPFAVNRILTQDQVFCLYERQLDCCLNASPWFSHLTLSIHWAWYKYKYGNLNTVLKLEECIVKVYLEGMPYFYLSDFIPQHNTSPLRTSHQTLCPALHLPRHRCHHIPGPWCL